MAALPTIAVCERCKGKLECKLMISDLIVFAEEAGISAGEASELVRCR